jgi:transposase
MMAENVPLVVYGGVDTHADVHVAAAVDYAGRVLGTCSFPAAPDGYAQLLQWLRSCGELARAGVEGTGSYGAGLARHLAGQGVQVLEVTRPDRQRRRRNGKSDPVDAVSAAMAALRGEDCAVPKAQDGPAEALRALRAARRGAVKARTQAGNQLTALLVTAPEPIRVRLHGLRGGKLAAACTELAGAGRDGAAAAAMVTALASIARRWLDLDGEDCRLQAAMAGLVTSAAPGLLDLPGAGPLSAAALIITAGDNPARIRREASFAALCGVSPVDCSSGKQQRHRLNQGGDRQANTALWRIVTTRMRDDPRTQAYVAKRTADGKTRKEIIRCLKRYVAREIFKAHIRPAAT